MVDTRLVAGVVVPVLLVLAALAVPATLGVAGHGPVGTVAAQDGSDATADDATDADEGEEGGVEGRIRSTIAGHGLVGAGVVLLLGVVVLTVSTEKLISYLTRASLGLRVSLFTLAIVFTGFEFDDLVLAVVLSAGDLEGVALGTALGTGLAITGFTLALAAIVSPFPVDIPTDYLVLLAVGPILLIPVAMAGTLTLVHGVLLIGFFVVAFGYLVVRELQREIPVFRSTDIGKRIQTDGGVTVEDAVGVIPEDRLLGRFATTGWVWLALAVLALVGIVFASMLLEAGSEVVVSGLGIEETVFGATVLTLILTFEDIMLTIEPVRRGVPEIGVGNVIGSVLFSVTGNIGVIMLLSDLQISASVLTLHLPAIVVVTSLAAYFLYTGELKRWHGYALGGLYVCYWVLAILLFGGVPVGG